MGFAITAMAFPLMLYAQLVRGLSPTARRCCWSRWRRCRSCSPLGGQADRRRAPTADHRRSASPSAAGSLLWLSQVMTRRLGDLGDPAAAGPARHRQRLHLGADLGHRDPQPADAPAGAGAGIYNATRQVGAVLGSAAIAVLMDSRLAAQGLDFTPSEAGGGNLPQQVLRPVRRGDVPGHAAPGRLLLVGLLAALAFARPKHQVLAAAARDPRRRPPGAPPPCAGALPACNAGFTLLSASREGPH